MLLMFGCQSLTFDPRGHIVPESSRIAFPRDGEASGTWTNDDLILAYRFVRNQSQLWIAGSIQFADRITKVYLGIQYFHLDALLVDAQGKVLDQVGLTSSASINTVYDNSLVFNSILTLPPNTEAIAFSYRGKTFGTKDGGTMDFWEYPVH